MTNTTIRGAEAADAAVLADLGARTFTETFGHLYPARDLAAFLADTHTPAKAAAEIADPAFGVWLAEVDGAAIAYAVAGPCALPHPEVTTSSGELKRIYVLGDGKGRGLGARLMETAFAWLDRQGCSPLWIGVWSENHGAQRLYRRHGFEKVGEYEFHVGATRDREFILRRPQAKFLP
jgi:ribosomal protein S18 acetylase RimI-like enzyme